MQKKSRKSPYERYNKSSYRYSELFNKWKQARQSQNTSEARRLGDEHSERYFGRLHMKEVRRVKLS